MFLGGEILYIGQKCDDKSLVAASLREVSMATVKDGLLELQQSLC